MAFNFPNSPNVGDTYTVGSTTFQFNGIAWDYANTTAVLAFAQANAAYTKANNAAQVTFGTVIANGNTIVASSTNDTLTIISSSNVSIIGNTTSKNITFDITTTGITAATYGNAVSIPTFTVDTRGRLLSAANVSIDFSSTVLKTGNTMTGNLVMSAANIAFATATNTGLYWSGTSFIHSPGANTLVFGTSTTERMRIDANGKVGINSLASANLQVGGNISAFGIDVAGVNVAPTIVAAFLQANTANTTAVSAFLQANAGFLQANNAVLKTGNTMTGNLVLSGANIAFATATNTGLYWSGTSFIRSPAANILIFGTTSNEAFRIDSTGSTNIAIGLYVTGTVSDAKANVLSQTLTDGAAISWDASLGRIAVVTLGGARSLSNATNIRVGTYILRVQQNTTSGNSTLTFGRQYKFTANVAPVLTASANAVDIFSFVSDGTNMYGAMIPDTRS
jgi:hypothetical protein